jgi:hypothetical protein
MFQPKHGLSFLIRTQAAAYEHERRAYNVPPGVGIGWTPYKILITDGAISYCAFHSVRDFRRWLGGSFRVSLTGGYRRIRYGRIIAKDEGSKHVQPI